MLSTTLALLSLALYAAATAHLAHALRRARGPRNRIATMLGGGAVVLHAVVLYGALFTPAGLDLGFFHALSLATWVIVALMLVLSIAQPVDNLGIGLFPLAAIALLADLALGNAQPGPLITGAGIESHVLVSLVAWAVLGLAAMQAIVVGIQHRRLHRKLPTGAVRALPPLYVMETLLFRMIGIGFALLTLALLTGFVYLEDMFAQDVAHKTALSLLAWIMFGTLLGGHHAWGWRGPTAVRFTTGGFALLVLGYFGSKLVLELILARP